MCLYLKERLLAPEGRAAISNPNRREHVGKMLLIATLHPLQVAVARKVLQLSPQVVPAARLKLPHRVVALKSRPLARTKVTNRGVRKKPPHDHSVLKLRDAAMTKMVVPSLLVVRSVALRAAKRADLLAARKSVLSVRADQTIIVAVKAGRKKADQVVRLIVAATVPAAVAAPAAAILEAAKALAAVTTAAKVAAVVAVINTVTKI